MYNIDSVCVVDGSKELGEIFISDGKCALDKNLLKDLKITHVINAAAGEIQTGPRYYQDLGLKYLGITAVDSPNTNFLLYFDRIADFIHSCLIDRGKILVHCAMGISRSATCVIAYLIKYCNMDTTEAIKFLQQKRSIINPNNGFVSQLQKYHSLQPQFKNFSHIKK
ncbi:Putative dual specificity phosphatase 13 [Invertebrate iridescent virus 30]|uniref:protein-serine/threonine phosphatase n=1 Tax=Invertebrate iridescent virus 30 TaxID=345585 RepID=W8W2I0_9VIRU|nr:Putative dual specificity phosphatase 13 [Invertebrate iridescent virus 30]CCV02240.1 Putative dual specificity phosphatase 13 [Invertebrate iridescent virus 30]